MPGQRGSYKIIAHFQEAFRVQTITIGNVYTVQPLDPLKTKHRNRVCTVLGFTFTDEGEPQVALVRFHDTRHLGKVELEDLVTVGAS